MDMRADIEAIDRVRTAYVAALNAGDVEGWVGVFAEDGVQMPPNAPANIGRLTIRPWVEKFLGTFRCNFALDVQEIVVIGDWAFERGGYRIVLRAKAGREPIEDVGKYITIYQRQPGASWKMARDIWNSDRAMPA
jgi:uncharacterized protein (TIGR02246 family)